MPFRPHGRAAFSDMIPATTQPWINKINDLSLKLWVHQLQAKDCGQPRALQKCLRHEKPAANPTAKPLQASKFALTGPHPLPILPPSPRLPSFLARQYQILRHELTSQPAQILRPKTNTLTLSHCHVPPVSLGAIGACSASYHRVGVLARH